MPTTKQKIILTAKELFEEHGVASVRLQQIADKMGISTGNLTYHFRNKDLIVEAVFVEVKDKLQDIISTYRTYPNLLDLEHQLTLFYELSREYKYVFADIIELERSMPHVKSVPLSLIKKLGLQIQNRIEYNINRGILQQVPDQEVYDDLKYTIVNMIFFMPVTTSSLLKKELGVTEYKRMIWHLIIPYLTEDGQKEYNYVIEPLLI